MRIFIFAIFLMTFSTIAQEQTSVIESFKSVVSKFDNFIKTPQRLIYKQSFDKSLTGMNVEILEYNGTNLSYDIKKTESLITPYIGYIEIDFTHKTNLFCGNVFYQIGQKKHITGWDTEKAAINSKDSLRCYNCLSDCDSYTPYLDHIRFVFAIQDSKWIFKNATRTKYNKPELAISEALNQYNPPAVQLTDVESILFNKKWVELIN